jgi:hypothetical protein
MATAAVASCAKATGRERNPGDHDRRYITILPQYSYPIVTDGLDLGLADAVPGSIAAALRPRHSAG